MSSLLQSPGRTRAGQVELFVYLQRPDWEKTYPKQRREAETGVSTKYGLQPKLYRVWRKPVGMFGCWVVFRMNGSEHVPDLSVPWALDRLPRDAEPMTDEEQHAYWNRST